MCCSDPPSHICVEAASAAFSDMANYNLVQYAPLPLHNSRHVALHRQKSKTSETEEKLLDFTLAALAALPTQRCEEELVVDSLDLN